MTDEFTPLTIQDYATQALVTDQRSDSGSLSFPTPRPFWRDR